jgi:hypothetical protein
LLPQGKRKLGSWIESFIDQTESLHSPKIFRRWTAISTIAAALEQKVWLKTGMRPMFPNMFIFLVAHPGVGKTRTMREGTHYVRALPEFHLAPISMTFASLVDSLVKAKRVLIRPGDDALEYNSLYIAADELGAFIHKYDNEMIDGLSAFYDPDPYSQTRRTSDIRIKIESPQLNIICGTTPQNLTQLLPEKAWGQGFTSRLIMVFSDERIIGDDFAPPVKSFSDDLANDLDIINGLVGEFEVTADYRDLVNKWRQLGESPVPNHPKLIHYVTRRRAHLYKLSMVAAIDRSNALILTRDDFNTAMNWLLEAEDTMLEIFKAGATNADAQAMEEIMHFVKINDRGHGVSEQKITRFASDRIPLHSVARVVDIMERSGQIYCKGEDRATKIRYFAAFEPSGPPT